MNWFWVRLNKYFSQRKSPKLTDNLRTNLNWTKSSKPFEEMSDKEAKDFITRMAEGIFGNLPKKDL